jgi:ParB family chromosome partitioning protein
MMLALDQLAPGMYQPRTRMDEGALYELAESIKAQGIMQPILVRRLAANQVGCADDESQGPSLRRLVLQSASSTAGPQ